MTWWGGSHARRGSARAESLEPRALLAALLVADVQQGSADAGPSVLVAGPERLYFRAFDGSTIGNEPYTYTPAAGAALLKDVNPEGDSVFYILGGPGPPPPSPAVAAGSGFYFVAFEHTYGQELYYTDGTAAGTRLVKDVNPGPYSAHPDQLFVAGGTVYFMAEVYNPQTGSVRGLWKTDGTDAGTVAVRYVSNGAAVQAVTSMAVLDGVVYAAAFNALLRLDPAGAVPVKLLPANSSIRSLTPLGDALYFKAGTQLWRSDGTAANTVAVATIGTTVAANPQTFDGLRASGEALYFVSNSAGVGPELWRSDGTTEGTRLLKDLNPGSAASWPNHLTDVNGTLYFSAGAAGVGEALWKSDGTEGGTVPVVSLVPDVNPATRPITEVVAAGGTAFFAAGGPAGVAGLWASDGTTDGTARVTAATQVKSLTPFDGRVYFSGRSAYGSELWSSDGTAAGTRQVQDINTRNVTTRSQPEGLAEINGRVVFASDDGVAGRKLWSSDGTAGGTVAILDFPKHYSVHPFKPLRLGDRVYFVSGIAGSELWSTDGTAAGTTRIRSFPGDTLVGGIGRFSSALGMLLFFAADAEHGRELWASDGTADGTRMLKEFTPGTAGTYVGEEFSWRRTVEAGGAAYFVLGNAIYKTDGTESGTALLRNFGAVTPDWPVALGDRVLFATPSPTGAFNGELWVTDGTPAGTTLVHGAVSAQSFAALGNFVLFYGNGGLWRSDGTPAGTFEIWPSGTASVLRNPTLLTAWNGAIYFRADPTVIWKTDGTRAGTVPVMTADGTQARLAGFGPFVSVGGHLYFAGSDAEHGSELWRTEGTDARAVRVADVLPGRTGSSPGNLVARGDTLYFFADDGVNGRELWRYDADAPAVTVAGRRVFYNNSFFDGRDAGATLADLGAVAPDKEPLLPGGTANFSNVTSYNRGLNGVLVDFAGVPPQTLTAADFEFRAGRGGDAGAWAEVAPAAVTHLVGPTGAATGRYAITFPDFAVRNTWLRVTVKANANTGLSGPDVFYFGNLAGDAGVSPLRVDTLDYVVIRRSAKADALLSSRTDFDRNGRVNAIDVTIARLGAGRSLSRLAPPAPVAPVGAAPLRRRSVWAELP